MNTTNTNSDHSLLNKYASHEDIVREHHGSLGHSACLKSVPLSIMCYSDVTLSCLQTKEVLDIISLSHFNYT